MLFSKSVGTLQDEKHFINVKYFIITAASKREAVFSWTFRKKIYRNVLETNFISKPHSVEIQTICLELYLPNFDDMKFPLPI